MPVLEGSARFARARKIQPPLAHDPHLALIETALTNAGVSVEVGKGLTDEGEAWCAFLERGAGEVIVHLALIDGLYVCASSCLPAVLRGRDLDEVVQSFLVAWHRRRPARH